ncbi:hypothetical protein ACFOKF_14870 [Sphingobium rhizovicinum]|uniref:Uncharacterized protein n=1 Tax=Sphingobium rhizovicinum TaxID=432308 RepID=A0ABV7NGK5_9SPHN
MTKVKPSDLPTKTVRAPNGEIVRLKVVQSDSETLPYDLLAAFRSNVRSIRDERRRKARDAADTAQA